MKKSNLLIITAHQKEITGLPKWCDEHGLEYFETGVGTLDAMTNFHNKINSAKNGKKTKKFAKRVLLLGTAGSFDREDIFYLGISHSFVYPPRLDEDIPEFMENRWETTPAITLPPHKILPPVTLFSSWGISNSAQNFEPQMAPGSPKVISEKSKWENMEAMGLSWICRKYEIPFTAVMCCTNQIGPDGRGQWKKNHEEAGDLLLEFLESIM